MKGEVGAKESSGPAGRTDLTLLPSSEGLYIASVAPNICSWNLTILLCASCFGAILSQLKHESQLVAVWRGLLYGGHGNDSERPVARAQTPSPNVVKFLTLSPPPPGCPFRPPPSHQPSPQPIFFSPLSLVTGNISIGAFPKLFLTGG